MRSSPIQKCINVAVTRIIAFSYGGKELKLQAKVRGSEYLLRQNLVQSSECCNPGTRLHIDLCYFGFVDEVHCHSRYVW